MSQPSSNSERFTAIASTLVAIAILAAGVTAQQSHQTPQSDLARLESDLRFQLERAYKHNGSRRGKRMAQVDSVLQAWQESPKSSQDRQLLTNWLTEATINTMPGSSQSFPPTPKFGQTAQARSTKSWIKDVSAPQLVESENSQTIINPFFAASAKTPDATPTTAIDSTPTPEIIPQPQGETVSQPALQTASLQTLTEAVLPKDPTPQATPAETIDAPIYINLVELSARIEGYHDSLDAVETKLLTLSTPDLKILAKQIKQLDDMARDFHFVSLYYDALADKERRTVTQPRTMEATLAEINRHLDRYEKNQNDDFLNSFDTKQNKQLESLRTQLADIKDRVAQ